MPLNADVPAETDILCEHCGYGLNGLPTDGRCPECGEPIANSTTADGRSLPPWETGSGSRGRRFVRTTLGVILSPARFFRHLQTRTPDDRSRGFASRQHWLSAVLFGCTTAVHADTMGLLDDLPGPRHAPALYLLPVFILAVRLALHGITRLASALTHWEGGYWGYRMPTAAVRRVMNFHTAQLLPIAIVALVTVVGYRVLLDRNILTALAGVKYLLVLSIEVLIGAGYLFRTYWIAMKNIMYANR
jgi:hypothetical protein